MSQLTWAIAEVGQAFTVVVETTEACPCTAKTGRYSAEWHRLNPGAPSCGGRGVIVVSSQDKDARGIWQVAELAYGNLPGIAKEMTEVGIIERNDVVMYAAAYSYGNAIDWSAINLVKIDGTSYRVVARLKGFENVVAILRKA